MIAPIGLLWGEGRAADFARFWLAEPVAADDGVEFSLEIESDDAAPAGLGGECAFTQAFVTVRAAAGTTLQFTPIVNDDDSLTRPHPSGSIGVMQVSVTIPQQAGGPPTPMLTQTFAIPLRYTLQIGGIPVSVFHPRGERCRIRVESTSAIGTGALRLEQCELEYQILRRSDLNAFTAVSS